MERDRWSIKVITIRNQILHRVHTKLWKQLIWMSGLKNPSVRQWWLQVLFSKSQVNLFKSQVKNIVQVKSWVKWLKSEVTF
jgi:hypothetical protein